MINMLQSMEAIDKKEHLNGLDKKARRRTNVSSKVANISAKDIEAGNITFEILENLNVPMFLYGGQLTIHGTLPDVNTGRDLLGYKSIINNNNGTLGVKYSAIDSEKKRQVVEAINLSKNEAKWFSQVNSKGMTLGKCFGEYSVENVKTMFEAKKDIPSDLLYGNVFACRCPMTNRIYLCVEVNAIPMDNLQKVIETFAKVNQEQLRLLKEEKQKERDEYQKKLNENAEKRKQLEEEVNQKFKIKVAELGDKVGYKGFGKYKIMFVSNYQIGETEVDIQKSSFGRVELTILESNKKKTYKKDEFESFVNSSRRVFVHI